MLFAAVHESGYGTIQHLRRCKVTADIGGLSDIVSSVQFGDLCGWRFLKSIIARRKDWTFCREQSVSVRKQYQGQMSLSGILPPPASARSRGLGGDGGICRRNQGKDPKMPKTKSAHRAKSHSSGKISAGKPTDADRTGKARMTSLARSVCPPHTSILCCGCPGWRPTLRRQLSMAGSRKHSML